MIKESLNAFAATLQKEWKHDRSTTVGASEVGQCARKVWYTKNDAGVDAEYIDGWGARLRGVVYEDTFWAPAIKASYGSNALYVGRDQHTFVDKYLSATPDGLLINQPSDALLKLGIKDIESDCICLDAKTCDPRTNLNEAKQEHVFQVTTQMGLVRETTDYKPMYAVLSYTNASFWDDVKLFAVKFDPSIYNTAKIRATEIMTATSATELKPEGFIAGGRECELCPFTRACGVVRRSVPESNEVADPQLVAQIADMVTMVKKIENEIDEDSALLRYYQQEIRDTLRSHSVKKIPGLVSWSSIKGRKTYDSKKLQEAAIAAGIDIEQFAKVSEDGDRLTITAPKAEAA